MDPDTPTFKCPDAFGKGALLRVVRDVDKLVVVLSALPCFVLAKQAFQRVEKETEARSKEVESAGLQVDSVVPASGAMAQPNPTPRPAGSITTKPKDRRRGSISISRLGQAITSEDDPPGVVVDTGETTNTNGIITPACLSLAVKSPYYQEQLANTTSRTSLTSSLSHNSTSTSNRDPTCHEEQDHITQMHHIAPRPTIATKIIQSGVLPRRLSTRLGRANSTRGSVIPRLDNPDLDDQVVIGVSVEAKTVETRVEEEEEGEREESDISAANGAPAAAPTSPVGVAQRRATITRRASVSAAASVRTKPSTGSLAPGRQTPSGSPTTTMRPRIKSWLQKGNFFAVVFGRARKVSVSNSRI